MSHSTGDVMQAVRGRLGAARVLLEPLVRDSAYPAISRNQATAVVECLSRGGDRLSADDRTMLLQVATTVPWADGDSSLVLTALAGGEPAVTANLTRRPQQDFRHFLAYLTADRWENLLDTNVSAYSKQEVILEWLRLLGLRNPTEPTLKFIASSIILLAEGWEKAQVMQVGVKKCYMRSVGSDFKRSVRMASAPIHYIASLPALPDDFKARYGDMYDAIYGAGPGPVPPQIDTLRLTLLDDSYKCRGGGSDVIGTPTPHGGARLALPSATPTLNLGPGMQQVEQFGNMLVSCMQQMHTQQTKMMEMVCGTSSSPPPGGSGVGSRGLRSLVDSLSPRASVREHAVTIDTLVGRDAPLAIAAPAPPSLSTLQGQSLVDDLRAKLKEEESKLHRPATEPPLPRSVPAAIPLSPAPLPAVRMPTPLPAQEIDSDDDLPLKSFIKPRPRSAAEIARERASKICDMLETRDKEKAALAKKSKAGVAREAGAAKSHVSAGVHTALPPAKRCRLRVKTTP